MSASAASAVPMLPAMSSWSGNSFLIIRTVSRTRLGVAVGVVDDEDVALGRDQGLGPLERVLADADRRPDPQAAERVLGRARVLGPLEDVLVGDEPLEVVVLVHHHDLLDLVLVEELLGLLERSADGDGDELPGHDLVDRGAQPGLEPDVPVGQDADQLVVLVGDRAGPRSGTSS